MRRMWIGMVVLGLVMATSARLEGAGTPEAKPTASAPPKKAVKPAEADAAKGAESNKGEKEPTREASTVEVELQQLRDLLESQAQQLQAQSEQLRQQQQKMQTLEEELRKAVTTTAEVKSTAVSLNSKVSDLKASNEALKTTVATEQAEAKKATEEGPTTIKYKGISITPGGFLAAETVFRTRNDTSDINTDFTGIPYPGQASSKINENQFSGRQSRLSLLAQTKVGTANVSAYYEGDFLNAGVTSNNRQSNSYGFRQRQAWASLKFDNGFYVSGGQMWSLVTESKKGIENRQEAFPLQIDAQYVVGWAWQRAYGFRVAHNWDKFAVGFSVEGPQTTIGGRNFNPNFFFNNTCDAAGLLNQFDPNGCTINKSPDFMVKATLDPGWGHYEIVGILSPFRNRVYPCFALSATQPIPGCTGTTDVTGAFNDTRVGGGIGVTARFPVIAKKLDLVAHFQGGDGIGRYSSAQLKDVTARPDGTLAPIRSAAWLGMLELHPHPKFDVYAYGGGEYAARTAYVFTNAAGRPVGVGYGSPLANNSGCSTETVPTSATGPSGSAFPTSGGTCNGDIRTILEGTLGFWYKFYQGSKGRLQFGVQYSYFSKIGWSGNNTSPTTGVAGPSVSPMAVDNMVFTSFRFYLP